MFVVFLFRYAGGFTEKGSLGPDLVLFAAPFLIPLLTPIWFLFVFLLVVLPARRVLQQRQFMLRLAIISVALHALVAFAVCVVLRESSPAPAHWWTLVAHLSVVAGGCGLASALTYGVVATRIEGGKPRAR